MAYQTVIETKIDGIPCKIGVISYVKVKGSYSYNAPSDLDYSGYTEMEYDILDRKGYKAAWLERKLDAQGKRDIEFLIDEHYKD